MQSEHYLSGGFMEKNKIPMNSIEIDDDVLRILKQNAEPFDDTPNTVLRSILGIDKNGNYVHGEFKFTGEEYYNIPSIIDEELNQ